MRRVLADGANIIIFVLDSSARTRFWMVSGFVSIKAIVG